jgi:hypothetical protein
METKTLSINFIVTSIILTIIFIAFIAVVIFSSTALIVFGNSDNDTKFSDVSGGEALDLYNLASLSAKYESSGNPGIIGNNKGDWGGKSYGTFQFASNVGTLANFLSWLKDIDSNLYKRLTSARDLDGGFGSNFDNEWRKIANEDSEYFYTLQYNFTKKSYFDVVIDYFKDKGIDYTKRSYTLQSVIWSSSVQHGSYGAIGLIKTIDIDLDDDLEDDARFIKAIYAEKRKVNIYFASSSQSIKNSVYNRFINEEKDALVMLKVELD